MFHVSKNKARDCPHTNTAQWSHKRLHAQILVICPVTYCQLLFIWCLQIQTFNVFHILMLKSYIDVRVLDGCVPMISLNPLSDMSSLHISLSLSSWSSSCPLLFVPFVMTPSSCHLNKLLYRAFSNTFVLCFLPSLFIISANIPFWTYCHSLLNIHFPKRSVYEP